MSGIIKLLQIEIREVVLIALFDDNLLTLENVFILAEYYSNQPEITAALKMIAEEKKIASNEYRKRMETVEALEKKVELLKNRTDDEQF